MYDRNVPFEARKELFGTLYCVIKMLKVKQNINIRIIHDYICAYKETKLESRKEDIAKARRSYYCAWYVCVCVSRLLTASGLCLPPLMTCTVVTHFIFLTTASRAFSPL
jgi:hypothetical protein